ncbi:hypothetical protein [Burkholderia cepacia]|uniref:hypothetical protein n=1 Tax=Burkholderia cepacia TaxID=292 RepID=UPI001783BD1F|nr:hypothetical protein [Burkholderia cepacia]QOH38450.1 hypothetical protein C7S14_0253 [Burkholderia cepacia]
MKELRKKSVRARWTNRHDVAMRTRASIGTPGRIARDRPRRTRPGRASPRSIPQDAQRGASPGQIRRRGAARVAEARGYPPAIRVPDTLAHVDATQGRNEIVDVPD